MPGLEIVDVAIGLTLVYLLLASIASAIRERIEAVFKSRAVDLERGIAELLQDHGRELTQQLYAHPLLNGLFQGQYDRTKISARNGRYSSRSTLPSYIPAHNFALALMDTVASNSSAAPAGAAAPQPLTLSALREGFAQVENPAVRRALLLAVDRAQGDINQVQANIEAWYNSGMDRVSGWYRRRSQWIILGLSLALTLAVNANTLTIMQRLSIDTPLRQALVAQAGNAAAPDSAASTSGAAAYWQQLGSFGLPLGWDEGWPGARANPLEPRPQWNPAGPQLRSWLWIDVFQPLLGWSLTVLAVSMGAPFWFDTLNRLTSLRSTLKPKDAAPSAPATVVQLQAPSALAVATPSAPAVAVALPEPAS